MSVTDERSAATDRSSQGLAAESDDRSAPRRRHMPARAIPPWVQLTVVAAVVLVVFVVWWFAGLRHDVRELSAKVDAIAEQGGPVMMPDPPTTTSLPPDRPPVDGEESRRLIDDAVRVVFTPAVPGPERVVAVVDPGPGVQALADASAGARCVGGTVGVTTVRFTDDDHAVAVVTFDLPDFPVARSYPFRIDVSRVGDAWKVAGSSVDAVLGMARGVCAG